MVRPTQDRPRASTTKRRVDHRCERPDHACAGCRHRLCVGIDRLARPKACKSHKSAKCLPGMPTPSGDVGPPPRGGILHRHTGDGPGHPTRSAASAAPAHLWPEPCHLTRIARAKRRPHLDAHRASLKVCPTHGTSVGCHSAACCPCWSTGARQLSCRSGRVCTKVTVSPDPLHFGSTRPLRPRVVGSVGARSSPDDHGGGRGRSTPPRR
jgi:hypothetical protein